MIDLEFESGGDVLRGWRVGDDGAPVVVMAHGFSAVKEMHLDEYAAAFAARGLGAIVFDHPGFGASDGEPRQDIDPERQLQGYRDAIGVARRTTDRVAAWGTSFSGGHAIVLAATDDRLTCAVAQAPYLEVVPGGSPPDLEGLDRVPVTAVLTADGGPEWFTRQGGRAPAWRDEITVDSLYRVGAYRPLDSLRSVRVPTLVIAAEDDTLTPPTPAYAAIGHPLVTVARIPGNHFAVYDDPTSYRLAADVLARHLLA